MRMYINMAEHPLGCLLSLDGYFPSDLISVKSFKLSDLQIVLHVSSTIHHRFFSLQRLFASFIRSALNNAFRSAFDTLSWLIVLYI